MDEIERELHDDEYGNLQRREARLKERREAHVRGQEDCELRKLVNQKLIEQVLYIFHDPYLPLTQEEGGRVAGAVQEAREACTVAVQSNGFDVPAPMGSGAGADEIAELRRLLPGQEIISTILDTIQLHFAVTQHRDLTAKLLLPADYPASALAIELHSPHLHPDVMAKLEASSTAIARGHVGGRQVVPVVTALRKVMHGNRLAPAYEELQRLQAFLKESRGVLQHAHQASGRVDVRLQQAAYFMELTCTVLDEYPLHPLQLHMRSCNLPNDIVQLNFQQARHTALRLAEPLEAGYMQGTAAASRASATRAGAGESAASKSAQLLRLGKQTMTSSYREQDLVAASKERSEEQRRQRQQALESHVAQPSLYTVVEQLYTTSVAMLASGKCHVCLKRLIPADPEKLCKVPTHMQVLKLDCGHLYHEHCCEAYLSSPPFNKTCHECKAPIQHSKLLTDAKVLEARWAAVQARQRQFDEVADFLQ